jgi:hypothetical protein
MEIVVASHPDGGRGPDGQDVRMAGNIEKKTTTWSHLVASQNMRSSGSGAVWRGGRISWEAGGDFAARSTRDGGALCRSYFDSVAAVPVPDGDGYNIYLEAARTDRSQAGGFCVRSREKAVRHSPYSWRRRARQICMLRTRKVI